MRTTHRFAMTALAGLVAWQGLVLAQPLLGDSSVTDGAQYVPLAAADRSALAPSAGPNGRTATPPQTTTPNVPDTTSPTTVPAPSTTGSTTTTPVVPASTTAPTTPTTSVPASTTPTTTPSPTTTTTPPSSTTPSSTTPSTTTPSSTVPNTTAPPSTTSPSTNPPSTAPPGSSSTNGGVPLGDEQPVEANYQASDFLRTGLPIPRSTAHEPTGNFRQICELSHFAYDDPILAAGRPGTSHLHMFFGNTGTDAFSTYESLRTTGESTCQGGPLNRSAYWAPAVIDANGDAVAPDHISVYYKGRGYGTDSTRVDVVSPPPGLRMIAGSIPGDTASTSKHNWYCETNQIKAKTIPNCAPGERVGIVMAFPTCWNGTELDAADHRSHMAYPVRNRNTGKLACPTTHPVSLPEFTLGIWFSHDGDSANWHLASDRLPGQPEHQNGASFHSDWFGAWDLEVQDVWTNRCINGQLDCSWGDLGNGTALSVNPEYKGPQRVTPPELPAQEASRAQSLQAAGSDGVVSFSCALYGN